MATHSSVLAWRIPGTVEPDGLPSVGSHRVRHDWSNLAAAATCINCIRVICTYMCYKVRYPFKLIIGFLFSLGMDIFQVILSETANRIFLAESGRKILSALIVKARKVNLFCWQVYFIVIISIELMIKNYYIFNRRKCFCRYL